MLWIIETVGKLVLSVLDFVTLNSDLLIPLMFWIIETISKLVLGVLDFVTLYSDLLVPFVFRVVETISKLFLSNSYLITLDSHLFAPFMLSICLTISEGSISVSLNEDFIRWIIKSNSTIIFEWFWWGESVDKSNLEISSRDWASSFIKWENLSWFWAVWRIVKSYGCSGSH